MQQNTQEDSCYKELGDLDITRESEQIIWLFVLVGQLVAISYVSYKLYRIRRWMIIHNVSYNNKLFFINATSFILLLLQFSTMVYAEIYSFDIQDESLDNIQDFQTIYNALWVASIILLLSIIGLASLYWMNVLINFRYYRYLKYLVYFQKVFLLVLYILGPLSILLLFFDEDISFYVISIFTFCIETIFIVSCFQFWKDIEDIYDLSDTFKSHVKKSVMILGIACILRVIYNICGAAGVITDIHCFDQYTKQNTNIAGSIVSCLIFINGATLPILLLSSIFSPHQHTVTKKRTLLSSQSQQECKNHIS